MTKSPYNGAFGDGLSKPSAYWLGFIWADGSIGKYGRQHRFSIGLQSTDRGHLKKLVKYLGYSEGRIDDRNGTSHFQAHSIDLFNDLWEWGIRPNKSDSIEQVHFVDDYMTHFVRGLFDGDGSIGVYEREGGRSARPRFAFYGKKPLVELVNREIEQRAGVESQNISKKKTGVFSVNTAARKNMQPLFDMLYSDGGPWLKRKYEKFKEAAALDPAPDPGYEKYDENGRALLEITCNLCEKECWKRADQVNRSELNYCSRECAAKTLHKPRGGEA